MMKAYLSLFWLGSMLSAAAQLQILPSSVELAGPEARQQLLAESTANGYNEDRTRHRHQCS